MTPSGWKASNMLLRKSRGQVQVAPELLVGPKPKGRSAADAPGNEMKVRCCKEKYCIGTWNVRSMNLGKLDVVKQEIARININILGSVN